MWFKETPRSPFVLGNRGVYWYASQLVVAMLPERGAKACFAVEPGETWQMEFKHSYELTLWRDNFTVNGADDMVLTHTIYQSQGCGFPFSASEGKFEALPDGHFKLTLNRPYKIIKMRPAVQASPKILHNETVYGARHAAYHKSRTAIPLLAGMSLFL